MTIRSSCALPVVLAALASSGCVFGGDQRTVASSGPKCPSSQRSGWQQLANEIRAPVYCPSWLPDPLIPDAHHASVDPDRSYQAGFHDPELRSAEVHVVLSGYPGKRTGPRCENPRTGGYFSCWLKPSGQKRLGTLQVTVYETGLGHESRHLIYAWSYRNTLYAASIHVDPRLTRARARRDLNRIVLGSERIEPGSEPPGDSDHEDG